MRKLRAVPETPDERDSPGRELRAAQEAWWSLLDASPTPPLPRLALARFRVTFQALAHSSLPAYLGSTLRGAFGHAFRRACCWRSAPVEESCSNSAGCAYSYVFETPVPRELSGRHGGPFAPHPFVLCPLDEAGGSIRLGDMVTFSVTLIGRGIHYLPIVLRAIEVMGERGLGRDRVPFAVAAVTDTLEPHGRPLYDPVRRELLGSPEVLDLATECLRATMLLGAPSAPACRLRVRFLTPVKLMRDGSLVARPDLETILAALHRRLESLTIFHGEGPAAWDWTVPGPGSSFSMGPDERSWDTRLPLGQIGDSRALRAVASQSRMVRHAYRPGSWERLSTRQNRKVTMEGVEGEVFFEEVPVELLPWLAAGQWLHVGKATAFGMGRYALELADA